MRTNDEAIANNTANYNPDEYDWRRPHEVEDEEAWRQHSAALDEQTIRGAVERMMRCGAKADVMVLFDELIREHRLDPLCRKAGK